MEYITTTFQGKGFTAIIHKPILTPEERAKREAEIIKAMVEVKKEMIRNAIAKGESI